MVHEMVALSLDASFIDKVCDSSTKPVKVELLEKSAFERQFIRLRISRVVCEALCRGNCASS